MNTTPTLVFYLQLSYSWLQLQCCITISYSEYCLRVVDKNIWIFLVKFIWMTYSPYFKLYLLFQWSSCCDLNTENEVRRASFGTHYSRMEDTIYSIRGKINRWLSFLYIVSFSDTLIWNGRSPNHLDCFKILHSLWGILCTTFCKNSLVSLGHRAMTS